VAEGRKIPIEQVNKIGKGRVWTGAQAKELGLVDDLGGLDRAVVLAKKMAGIPADRDVQLVRFPREKSIFEQLFSNDMWSETTIGALLSGKLERLAKSMQTAQALVPLRIQIR